MKRISLLAVYSLLPVTLFLSITVQAQQLADDWHGTLQAFPIIVHITWNNANKNYQATMDSPEQNAYGYAFDSFTVVDNQVKATMAQLHVTMEGTIENTNRINGQWKQGMVQLPFIMDRGKLEIAKPVRPQEPFPPFPYHTTDVTFTNTDKSITYGGTLTTPEAGKNFPVALLISGSGAQNRNSEIFGHKPFLLIADYLTRHGIAVLRVDDRGVGQTTGHYQGSTIADFTKDAAAAVAYLKTRKDIINPKKIGLIGHSEGGAIAPTLVAGDKDIAFMVLLAGPGVNGKNVMLAQNKAIASAIDSNSVNAYLELYGKITDLVLATDTTGLYTRTIKMGEQWLKQQTPQTLSTLGITAENISRQTLVLAYAMSNPEIKSVLAYDPLPVLSNVKCPVLALNGSKDVQIVASLNLPGIKKILTESGNKDVTTIELPGLNHLFQTAGTGMPSEYKTITETFSPKALEQISSWILQHTNKTR
ncbi:hypothetical protein CLV51_101923 [Chitinophaga niastensis]|uniref:Serine aminopeptidase S33 domain-containing protein n=1 Tax=Chitinophaga niastensis TaxID=536980 RepID=A0A2P8HTN2_CHINA|nr:alpha/beta fold hydrolase [Chitinophaga niastensis]PSL49589.1 hypothetical protein CLV51_101923 [Chitinophaga niastensis]